MHVSLPVIHKISLTPAVYTNTHPHANANAHKPKMTHVCYRISYPHHISPGQGESLALVSFYFLILLSSSQSLFYPQSTRYVWFFENKKKTKQKNKHDRQICEYSQTLYSKTHVAVLVKSVHHTIKHYLHGNIVLKMLILIQTVSVLTY